MKKNLRKYAIAVGILAAGCAALKNYNSNSEKKYEIRQIPIIQTVQPKIEKAPLIDARLEEICKNTNVELTESIDGHKLPAHDMYITTFSLPNRGGAFHAKRDPYYFAMRFDYVNLNKKRGCSYDFIAREWWKLNHPNTKQLYDKEASIFWKNKIVLVYNPNFKDPKTKKIESRAVICRAQDWGPAAFVVEKSKKQVIDASHKTVKYLFGRGGSGWSDRNQVYTYLVKDQNIKTGPISYKELK